MLSKQEFENRIEAVKGFVAVSSALRLIAIHTDAFKEKDVEKALDEVSSHLGAMLARLEQDMKP